MHHGPSFTTQVRKKYEPFEQSVWYRPKGGDYGGKLLFIDRVALHFTGDKVAFLRGKPLFTYSQLILSEEESLWLLGEFKAIGWQQPCVGDIVVSDLHYRITKVGALKEYKKCGKCIICSLEVDEC